MPPNEGKTVCFVGIEEVPMPHTPESWDNLWNCCAIILLKSRRLSLRVCRPEEGHRTDKCQTLYAAANLGRHSPFHSFHYSLLSIQILVGICVSSRLSRERPQRAHTSRCWSLGARTICNPVTGAEFHGFHHQASHQPRGGILKALRRHPHGRLLLSKTGIYLDCEP